MSKEEEYKKVAKKFYWCDYEGTVSDLINKGSSSPMGNYIEIFNSKNKFVNILTHNSDGSPDCRYYPVDEFIELLDIIKKFILKNIRKKKITTTNLHCS